MADIYVPADVPLEYDQQFFAEELRRISGQLQVMELPYLLLVPQAVEPLKLYEGVVAHADGTNWNPGHGVGLYEYVGTAWVPLFGISEGIVTAQVSVANTVTETEVYAGTLSAEALHAGDMSILSLGGSYDTGAASDTWTIRIKLAGTTIHTIVRQSANNVTAAGWVFEFTTTIRTEGASGTFVDLGVLSDDDTSYTVADAATHTIDTTVDNAISVTIQWGAAKAANIFRLDQGIVEHQH